MIEITNGPAEKKKDNYFLAEDYYQCSDSATASIN